MRAVITKSYGKKLVLDHLELECSDGEIVCVLGGSGVGKTTLLKALGGLIDFEGEKTGCENTAFVFQEPRLLPHLTALENLLYTGAGEEEAKLALEKCRLSAVANQRAATLSGGEKQRVALARCFCTDACLWLLDEPFSALDTPLKTALWEDFVALWEERKPTVVLVTHDLEEAWSLGHRIVLLREGRVVYDCRPVRTKHPTPYGEDSAQKQAFLRAVFRKTE
jgi:sulfonate transport system ATP-binding protein